jgi:hypothetical protein
VRLAAFAWREVMRTRMAAVDATRAGELSMFILGPRFGS